MSLRPSVPDSKPVAPRGNQLIALGSAAVLTVYAAGFAKTQAAAQQLEHGSDARRRPASAAGAPGGALPASPRAVATATAVHDENGVVTGPAPTSGPPAASSTPVASNAALVAKPSATGGAPLTSMAPASVTASNEATAAVAPASVPAAAPAATPASPPASAVANTPVTVAPAPTAPAPSPTPAAASPASAPAVDSAKHVGWRDGTYTGWGTSRHGDIEATVVVENGKITGAIISRCLTRYSCSWVAHLQAQVVTRQSPEVDNVSGATQSANAFYYAVIDALSKAK